VQDWGQYQPLISTLGQPEPASGIHDLSAKKTPASKLAVYKGEHGAAYLPEVRVPEEGSEFSYIDIHSAQSGPDYNAMPFDPKPEIPGVGGGARPFVAPLTPPEGGLSRVQPLQRDGHFEVRHTRRGRIQGHKRWMQDQRAWIQGHRGWIQGHRVWIQGAQEICVHGTAFVRMGHADRNVGEPLLESLHPALLQTSLAVVLPAMVGVTNVSRGWYSWHTGSVTNVSRILLFGRLTNCGHGFRQEKQHSIVDTVQIIHTASVMIQYSCIQTLKPS
jgi:hypothetical protein